MSFKKIFLFMFGSLLILAGLFFYFNSPPLKMRSDTFLIERGESLSHVAVRLKEKSLISNKFFFVYLAAAEGRRNIITGNYKIYRGMTSREIINIFSRGDILRRKITIPEGYNLYEIAARLEENAITDKDDFMQFAFDREYLQSIGISSQSAEGLLFPDTYTFAENQDARDVIIIMHKQFLSVAKSLNYKNIKKLKLNMYDIINLASLIEKEARIPGERKYISAVFHNRLKRKIPLGCDPTVRYAVKNFNERLTYEDLKYESLYNTYLHTGLPPTPICSPGKDSILAAMNPVKTDYLYFVSRNDGSHYFSKTLKEHNGAVEFYQKGINNGFIDRQK
jgi:UPF0755 protein